MDKDIKNKRKMAILALKLAEALLPYFRKEYPKDKKPGKAIKTLKEWIKTGVFSMKIIRHASLSSHASARKAKKQGKIIACYAARAIGQAVATCHVKEHSFGAVWYAEKIIRLINSAEEKRKINNLIIKILKNKPK
jgi:hypothetical protein